jgi:hypothetical protein
MYLKIRCDEEYEKFYKIFWNARTAREKTPSSRYMFTVHGAHWPGVEIYSALFTREKKLDVISNVS